MADKKTIFQPQDICRMMEITDPAHVDVAEKVLSMTLNLLAYLSPGDSLETNQVRYTKLSKELLFQEVKIKRADILNSLEKLRVIKIVI